MADVELTICGRPYQVRCRDGEEENLRAAGRLVDAKCREAIAGLGTLTEARQFFFAALLLADQMNEGPGEAAVAGAETDPQVAMAAEALAEKLESIASALESGAGAH
ncbi:cell division protein ZapA [Sphingomicrobium nitratireducens]|uniref:cell division protein ZapA n=1 Tax=Sphingomicrobium nitratireducens TaxID=2964666 RepID=UPI00223EE159|nr:cell division protein ZapA [Sphingomicrobium nitratireducens]